MQARLPPVGNTPARQRGMVLIVSMLLLLVVTLLAVAMFRSMGVGSKIAGNVREKQRALHAAESVEQYAVNWLETNAQAGSIPPATDCNSGIVNVNLGSNQVLVCSNIPYSPSAAAQGILPTSIDTFVPSVVPWQINNGATPVGFQFTPAGMTAGSCSSGASATAMSATGAAGGTYVCPPMFFISQLTPTGSTPMYYQIDSVGYGTTMDSVSVVESTYQVGPAVPCYTGICPQ